MDKRYYVYTLTDPRTDTVFYVGKGCRNRDRSHMVEARRVDVHNPYKSGRIREIEGSGHQVVAIRIHTGLSEPDALRIEREEIARHGIDNLTNVSKGNATAADRAAWMLMHVKSYEQWAGELMRSQEDLKWYDRIVGGLLKEAGLLE